MPLYFAYGLNLDRVGMAERCPRSTVVGVARLHDHRFVIMAAGYATVQAAAGAVVHGLLWDIDTMDWPELDAFEELDAGLYRRAALPVTHQGHWRQAAVYLAEDGSVGSPRAGYMESVIAAAETCELPASYRSELATWLNTP